MNQRVLVNVAVFAVVGAIMVVWAFQNVIKFDFIEQPYHITAEFQSSPGLHPNFEVDYLGTRIGKIDSVRLRNDRVIVKLDIDKGIKIPRGVTAQAARKSAVGEPVVELTPKPGQASGPSMPKDGKAVIPVSDTSVPPKYGDLFGSVIKVIKAINPDDVKVINHELALGWAGRENSLRQIIAGADQLSSTFASNSELIDGLTTDLGKITHVLAQNRGDLGAGFDNLASLVGALRGVRGELTQFRDRGPVLLKTVNNLFDKTGPDFNCTLGSLADIDIKSTNPNALDDLRDTLRQAPKLVSVLNNVIGEDQGLKVLNVVFLLTLKTKATLEYKNPLPQPKVNGIPNCPDGREPGQAAQKPFPGKKPGDTIPKTQQKAQQPAKTVKNSANQAPSSAGGPPGWLMYVPPVIALLVLIRVMSGSVPVLSRLRRRRRD